MLHLDLDGDYLRGRDGAGALQRRALSGLSREGTHYFYSNPLEEPRPAQAVGLAHLSLLHDERFLTARRLCRRLFPFRLARDGVAFHLYGGLEANARHRRDSKVALRETSDYPWSGDLRIEVDPEAPAAFDLKLRVAGWAKGAKATVNGEPIPLAVSSGYATIHRRWGKGDVVTLTLPMPAERLYAHPNVRMDIGRVALRRGPLIYCVEEADNPGQPVQTLELPRAAPIEAKWRAAIYLTAQ